MTSILLLEDNNDMLTMLSQVLEWGGYEVIKARSGQQGMDWLEKASLLPDLIISDLFMPEMDGMTFLGHVRANHRWSHLPVIIMSAHSSSKDRNDALSQGANDFIVKPFNLEDFNRVLEKWNQH